MLDARETTSRRGSGHRGRRVWTFRSSRRLRVREFKTALLCVDGGDFVLDGATCIFVCGSCADHLVGRGLEYVPQGLAHVAFVIVDVQLSSRAAAETAGKRTWVLAPPRNLCSPVRGLHSRVIRAAPCVLGSRGLSYVVLW